LVRTFGPRRPLKGVLEARRVSEGKGGVIFLLLFAADAERNPS